MDSVSTKLLVLLSVCLLVADCQYHMTPSREVVQAGPHGGTSGGDYFNDYTSVNKIMTYKIIGVQSIIISYSDQVESIQVTYRLAEKKIFTAPRHGSVKNINPPVEIKLKVGEYIHRIEGQTNGQLVDQLTIITVNPQDRSYKTYGPYGTEARTNFTIEGYVLGFFGRSGDMLDNIGAYYFPPAQTSPLFGSTKQQLSFDENPDLDFFPPVVRIKRLSIVHEGAVFAIQARYELMGGGTKLGAWLGWPSLSNLTTTVKFEDNEQILGIEGKAVLMNHSPLFYPHVCQLSFISRRENVSNPLLYNGPFGWPCLNSTKFAASGRIIGFYGFQYYGVVGLGFYYG